MRQLFRLLSGVLLICACTPLVAQSLPDLVDRGGRHASIVDGAPYLILGAQTNNSSNYPQLALDEFLVAGSDLRLAFSLDRPRAGQSSQFLDVEENAFEKGRWVMARRSNGDQVDYGLNLTDPTLLKVRLGTYR